MIALPDFKKGDELRISSVVLHENVTCSPKLHTEAELLSLFEYACEKIDDQVRENAFIENSADAAACMANTIETLIKSNYITRKNGTLVPTGKGSKLYQLLKDLKIADFHFMVELEMAINNIKTKDINSQQFTSQIKNYTQQLTGELLSQDTSTEIFQELKCPKCRRNHLLVEDIILRCPDRVCNWSLFRIICGVTLTLADLRRLVNLGKTALIKNMKNKKGEIFDAFIILNDKKIAIFQFQ